MDIVTSTNVLMKSISVCCIVSNVSKSFEFHTSNI